MVFMLRIENWKLKGIRFDLSERWTCHKNICLTHRNANVEAWVDERGSFGT